MNGLARLRLYLRPDGTGRQISWSLGQSAFEAGSMMVASLVAARLFGTVAWGQLGLILVVVQFVTMASDGLVPAIIRSVSAADKAGRHQALAVGRSLAQVCVGAACIITAIILLAALFWNTQQGITATTWLMAGAVVAVGRIARTVCDSVFRGVQMFRVPATAGIVCTGIMAAGVVAAALLGYRVGAYLYIMAGALVLNTVWLWSVLRKDFPVLAGEEKGEPVDLKEFFRFSWPLILRGAVLFLFLKINVGLIGLLADADAAGQFRLTDQFLTVPSLLLASAVSVFAPKVAAVLTDKVALSHLLSRMYGFLLLFTLPFALFFLLGGPILRVLFPDYAMVPEMNLHFVPAIIAQGIAYGAVTVLLQAGHSRPAFWLSAIPSVLNVIAALLGFKLFGVMGLVAGTALVHFGTFVATTVVTHAILKLPYRISFH